MILRTLLLTLCISITACCTSKKSASDAATNGDEKSQNMMSDKKMMEAGFTQGTIIANKDKGCPYVIEMAEDSTYFYDPIDIDESYKKDGMKIWFKFRPLKMMNRCENANPVSIEEVQVRK